MRRLPRNKIAIAAVLLTAVVALGGPMIGSWLKVPRINDITTTPEAPPRFEKLKDKPYPSGNERLQRQAYPNVKPLVLQGPIEQVFEVALLRARAMEDWDIVNVDRSRLRIEAVATTKLMRFKDDISIEIRPGSSPEESVIHVRSRSRLGKSDLGANAARILAYFGDLK